MKKWSKRTKTPLKKCRNLKEKMIVSLSWQKRQSMITFFTFLEENFSAWNEGFEFFVTPLKANDKITVKISKSQKTTFYLPHKTFVEKIDKVIAGIKAIMAFAEENGRFYVENILN